MSQVISVFSFDSFIYDTTQKSIWTPNVIFSTVVMLLSGTMNTLSFKLENRQNFKHGQFQSSLIFIGEYLTLLIYGIAQSNKRKQEEHFYDLVDTAENQGKSLHLSKFLMAIPSFFDTVGSILQLVATQLLPASVIQMLRGGVIIFTSIFSRIILGRIVHRHQIFGLSICLVGFVLVGIASIVAPTDPTVINANTGVGGIVLGLVLSVTSIICFGLQFIVEEKIQMTNEIPPMRMIGLEGLFGVLFMLMWINLSHFIPCPSQSLCNVYSSFEDIIPAVNQIFSNGLQMFWCVCTIFSIMLFNVYGLTLTKNVSSVFRSFWDATRTITVWIFSIMFGLEIFIFKAFIIQVFGFIFQIIGNFIYNEVIEIPFFNMNKYLRKYQIVKGKKRIVKKKNALSMRSRESGSVSAKGSRAYSDNRLSYERYDGKIQFTNELN